MVKINNKFGDIKIGTQGRAVYQRKHGQQIRRMREPKRAMASEAQVRHRQLYKAALDWRKSLSLANRRSLDGYAIANWIVDDHKIPLPWHRLALKLYLEHVHFTLLTKPTAGETGPWQMFESYPSPQNYGGACYLLIHEGQSFTPQESHLLDRIDVQGQRLGTPTGNAHLTLYLADANHKPTGSPIFDATFDPMSLPFPSYDWFTIPTPPTPLTAFTEYAFAISLPDDDYPNYLSTREQAGGGTYPRGQLCRTTDGGQSWTSLDGWEMCFKEYGTLAGTPGQPGELEIRHPALKTITRKHEGVIDLKWENMSSLDEMRLFNHLKLPADIGDLIEATTIADLTTKFQL